MIYAIGDIQGCFVPFQCLLKQIKFDPSKDTLWLAGDLINRGPQSLETLRFCYEHRDSIVAVQGNHDLHLLATAFDPEREPKRKDTIHDILSAPDRDQLLEWLISNPLLHVDHQHKAVMAHAGIAPCWTLEQAINHAKEVESVLTNPLLRVSYFKAMYGNDPHMWSDTLTGPTRWRTITNFFTRMRLCDKHLGLDLGYKGTLENKPKNLFPWYDAPNRIAIDYKIFFGHWAALEGKTKQENVIALDHGCVWGAQLSAYCIETGQWFHCDCAT